MSPANRKRFNAFEDFPQPDKPGQAQPQQPEVASPVASVETAAQVERIERLKPTQMLPDRFQPRRLLPASLRMRFFSGQINCYRAAREWLDLARQDSGYKAEVDRLLAMGNSFEDHGQIKAITGSWTALADGQFIFTIETGERRFWAACLRAVVEDLKEEPLLRVEVIQKPTRQRQVLENRHAEPPSSVSQACEVASLILAELGIQPVSDLKDEYDFFRQASAQRMPAGLWERIQPVMQLTRVRMVQLLNILKLPTPLLEMADRYRLPERVLREVLGIEDHSQWERYIRTAIQHSLTSDEVAELATSEETAGKGKGRSAAPAGFEPGRVALSGLRRFANAITNLDEVSQGQAMDEVADALVVSREAEGMSFLLGELGRLIDARLSRR